MGLKEEIKTSALNLGADLVGVASVERFDGAPSGFHPTDIMPETKSVVVIAKKISDQLVCGSLGTAYTNTFQAILRRLDYIASDVAVFVEKMGGKAIPIPADDPYTYWDEENHRGMGDLSHKHAAQAAGLGILGKNSLLITPQYGNRVHLVSVLTDLDLESDPLVEKELCPQSCRLCLDACPVGAIKEEQIVIQKLCRSIVGKTLPKGYWVYACWECRRVCPVGKNR
ncbi:epoxyqueuosine reductase [Desulfosporosinus sp. FKB]|uniref:epoxyqueuosine reductase n=1 Tax=Desulfosporosinus sp. FKB TaxID=1969835 RepID=UPI000B4A4A18|nr:epoxyqueuosine reductase [Desulfosporosinus sp. FKB]